MLGRGFYIKCAFAVLLGWISIGASNLCAQSLDPKLMLQRDKLIEATRQKIFKWRNRFDQTQDKIYQKAVKQKRSFCRLTRQDINMNGGVEVQDKVILLSCRDNGPKSLACAGADLNYDGVIDQNDLIVLDQIGTLKDQSPILCYDAQATPAPDAPTPTPTPVP